MALARSCRKADLREFTEATLCHQFQETSLLIWPSVSLRALRILNKVPTVELAGQTYGKEETYMLRLSFVL